MMKHFPDYMKNIKNKVDSSQQNTDDIEGYFYEGSDGSQMAFWECHADLISKKHAHDFDEYMVCVSGEYTAYLNEKKIVLKAGDELVYQGAFPEQCFTQPPSRYTEATLIKALEQKGIGRPSTYAPIISTIQERDYVNKANGKFQPTELGAIVSNILTEHFPTIVDPGFTADMEEQLDKIAQGEYEWIAVLQGFYPSFQDTLDRAWVNLGKIDLTQPSEETCPNCSRPMVIRVGRFGKFLACSGYPECKTTMPHAAKIGVACPQCGRDLVKKISKKKRVFYGCSSFPECKFAINRKPIAKRCPNCGNLLVQYRGDWAKCAACQHKVRLSEQEEHKEGVAS
jgi:DNA topoisomerase-1